MVAQGGVGDSLSSSSSLFFFSFSFSLFCALRFFFFPLVFG